MRTTTHRLTGAAGALGVALTAPAALTGPQVAVFVAAAVATSGGVLSPDVDNRPWWRATAGQLGAAFAHRRLMHWWGLPAVAAAWISLAAELSPVEAAAAWGAVLGWTLHLVGDLVFGARCLGRGPGVPLTPTRRHVGVGLRADGVVERCTAWLLGLAVPVLAVAVTTQAVTR